MRLIKVLVLFIAIFHHCQAQCDTPVELTAKNRDRRGDKTKLKVANYNAEWLFYHRCKKEGWDEFDKRRKVVSRQFPEIWGVAGINTMSEDQITNEAILHLNNIRDYLIDIEADIYVIEEVCDCKTLNKIVGFIETEKSALQGKYKAYCDESARGETKQQIGIITALDPDPKSDGTADIQYESSFHGFVSKHTIGRKKLQLFGVHFTAGETQESAMKSRGRQAASLKAALSSTDYVIVTGDMNTQAHPVRQRQLGTLKLSSKLEAETAVKSFDATKTNPKVTLRINNKKGKIKTMELDINHVWAEMTQNPQRLANSYAAKGGTRGGVPIVHCYIIGLKITFNDASKDIDLQVANRWTSPPLPTIDIKPAMANAFTNVAGIKTMEIIFRQVLQEKTFTELATLQKVTSDQAVAEKYSHKSLIPPYPKSAWDHFFISTNWPNAGAVRMNYVHEQDAGNERVNNGYSDHTPITMTITLADPDWNAYSSGIMYNNYYDRPYSYIKPRKSAPIIYGPEQQLSNISFLTVILLDIFTISSIVICMSVVPCLICGTFIGYHYTKILNQKSANHL
eukprot:75218_1